MFTKDQIGRRGQELLIAYAISGVIFGSTGSLFTMILIIPLIPSIYLLDPLGLPHLLEFFIAAAITFLILWFIFSLQHRFYISEQQKKWKKKFGKNGFVIWRHIIDIASLLVLSLLFILLTSSIAFALVYYFSP